MESRGILNRMTTAWQWERLDTAGERLRLLRGHFDLSPRSAALACGISDQTWRNYEHEDRIPPNAAIVIAMRFERDGDRARNLAQWLLNGGQMPPRPEPPYPFAPRGTARRRGQPDDDSHNRCCMSAERVA